MNSIFMSAQGKKPQEVVYIYPRLKSLLRAGFASTSWHEKTQMKKETEVCQWYDRFLLHECPYEFYWASWRSCLIPCHHLMKMLNEAGGFSAVTQVSVNLASQDENAKERSLCLLSSSLFLWPVLLYFEEDSEKRIRRVPKFGFLINLCLVACACSTGNLCD